MKRVRRHAEEWQFRNGVFLPFSFSLSLLSLIALFPLRRQAEKGGQSLLFSQNPPDRFPSPPERGRQGG
jgi:hypothetical protein